MHYDAVIIGAGLSGLSAGCRLANYGRKVRIFEKHVFPGGLNSYYLRNGVPVDAGLHALTNYGDVKDRSSTLNKILRQLRIKRDDLSLCPQSHSEIVFPGCTLRLDNDFTAFKKQVISRFPDDASGFEELLREIMSFDSMAPVNGGISARAVLKAKISSPLLREMLLCPVMFYGNPEPDDMDFAQFCIMFKSVIVEGMSRPAGGMKPFLDMLTKKITENGGELSLGNEIISLECRNGKILSFTDSLGEKHTARHFISCIGAVETNALCGNACFKDNITLGTMAFAEATLHLACHPSTLGITTSLVFRSLKGKLFFGIPEGAVECSSHIMCMPGNFKGCENIPAANSIRISAPASADFWFSLNKADYEAAKRSAMAKLQDTALEAYPALAGHISACELFTPCTIKRFTGHLNGAIYGSPEKQRTGRTAIQNLYLSGTDHGLPGIAGSLMSGILIANNCVLNEN